MQSVLLFASRFCLFMYKRDNAFDNGLTFCIALSNISREYSRSTRTYIYRCASVHDTIHCLSLLATTSTQLFKELFEEYLKVLKKFLTRSDNELAKAV